MVDGEHIDAPSFVVKSPAGTAVDRVPARDGLRTTNIRESGDVALCVPVLAGDETVFAIGACDCSERARAIIIASVVGD